MVQMASYEFYYDRVLGNPYLTYRIVGQKYKYVSDDNGSKTLDKRVLTDPEVIVRDVIRKPLELSVSHGYAYSTGGLLGLVQNYESMVEQWKNQYEAMKSHLENIVNQFFDEDSVNQSPYQFLKIINSSDYYKAFTGTEVEIPLTFEARLYGRMEGNEYRTPLDQLNRINEYFIGESIQAENKEDLRVYTAPHGYKGIQTQGFEVEGSLTLFIGRHIQINNLLLSNYSYSVSRETLCRTENGGLVSRGPLYIDVQFTLIPAVIFTSQDLKNIMNSDSSKFEAAENELLS